MTQYGIPSWKRNYFRDSDGCVTYVQNEDSVDTYVLNYADELASGESVSSVSTTDSGVTVSTSLSSPNLTLTVTGSSGETEVLATTSSGRKLWRKLRFVDPESWANDYYR